MLDHTKEAFNQVVADLKKTAYAFNVLMQVVYISYLIYALVARAGNAIVNGVLLGLSAAYFVFFLCATSFGRNPESTHLSKGVKCFYKNSKRLIKLYTLGVAVYGIYEAATNVSFVSVLLTALMVVFWLLDIVFEILVKYVTARVNLIVEGLKTDIDNVVKPFKNTGNFFKKLVGKEIEPEEEPSKQRLFLEQKVAEAKEQKKQDRAQKKQEDKLYKTQLRIEKKQEKRLKKQADKQRKAELAASKAPLALPAPTEEKDKRKR